MSATAIPNRAGVTEIYIGGAGDTRTRLVAAFAEARQRQLARTQGVAHYFPHYAPRRALGLARRRLDEGRPLVLVGHSWGCDTALRVLAKLPAKADLVICADPVSKSRLNPPPRPRNARQVLRIDARPLRPDRSDKVRALGHFFGGTLRHTLSGAHAHVMLDLNHFAFWQMMQAENEKGYSALDLINRVGQVSPAPGASSSSAMPAPSG